MMEDQHKPRDESFSEDSSNYDDSDSEVRTDREESDETESFETVTIELEIESRMIMSTCVTLYFSVVLFVIFNGTQHAIYDAVFLVFFTFSGVLLVVLMVGCLEMRYYGKSLHQLQQRWNIFYLVVYLHRMAQYSEKLISTLLHCICCTGCANCCSKCMKYVLPSSLGDTVCGHTSPDSGPGSRLHKYKNTLLNIIFGNKSVNKTK